MGHLRIHGCAAWISSSIWIMPGLFLEAAGVVKIVLLFAGAKLGLMSTLTSLSKNVLSTGVYLSASLSLVE